MGEDGSFWELSQPKGWRSKPAEKWNKHDCHGFWLTLQTKHNQAMPCDLNWRLDMTMVNAVEESIKKRIKKAGVEYDRSVFKAWVQYVYENTPADVCMTLTGAYTDAMILGFVDSYLSIASRAEATEAHTE
jgi:hypothetical protein